jgi:hypothetical protein
LMVGFAIDLARYSIGVVEGETILMMDCYS